ncbi:hypothetical protein OY671_007746, partial [Metschnikowia pulcherrima]
LDSLMAWNTGHEGGAATSHANNAEAGLSRLQMLISMHPDSPRPIEPSIGDAVHLIVHIARTPEGRRIESSSEALIWGMSGSALVMLSLWPHAAWASDTTGGSPYESYSTKVRQSMTGTVGYTFALVGIVVAGGVSIFGGDLNGFVRTSLSIVLVASMLVGANSVSSSITGGGAVITGTASPASAG